MMKYYLVEISEGDPAIAGRAVYEFEDENAAVAAYHSKLATAMRSDLFETELVMVIDSTGKAIKRERYIKPVPAPAEE